MRIRIGRRPLAMAVARAAVLLVVAAAAGCATNPTPVWDGVWVVRDGRFTAWDIDLHAEGGGVIGRAYHYGGSPFEFNGAPVRGPAPEVHFDVRVDRPASGPVSSPLWVRYVFTGRMRTNCTAEGTPCIRGTVEFFEEGRPTRTVPLEFVRLPG